MSHIRRWLNAVRERINVWWWNRTARRWADEFQQIRHDVDWIEDEP